MFFKIYKKKENGKKAEQLAMGEKPPKSVKPEANIIQKKKKISIGHPELFSYGCEHIQRWGFWNCGNGDWFGAYSYSKINHQVWVKEVRLIKVTLHCKFSNFVYKTLGC